MHSFITPQTPKIPKGPDTLFISPEKSIGIEEIRVIQHFLSRKSLGNHNTVIIENAHLLTLPAQHALLKTLEEPPANSLIYLVTTQPDSLLPTILSRCQISTTPYTSNMSDLTYLSHFLTSGVGDRLKFFEDQSFTRTTALEFLDNLEYLVHQNLSFSRVYPLISSTRHYLKSNCSLKLSLDFFALNLC